MREIYFAPPGEPSGRAPLAHQDGWDLPSAWDAMLSDLQSLAGMNVPLVLLLNAACYGGKAMSHELQTHALDTVTRLTNFVPLAAVTTMSPFLAQTLKKHYPDLEVRASINMRIGSVRVMDQLALCFDGFYMKRECNRDLNTIQTLATWCQARGKSLHMLVNSGCLYDCAFQTFHDNLVAHEIEVTCEPHKRFRYPAPCWEHIDTRAHWPALLQNTWIRPEDLHHYAAWFDTVKLATRMHANPRKVLGAYARGRYHGNLLDIMEPSHGLLLSPWMIANDHFPEDWFEKTTSCQKMCHLCNYCAGILDDVLTRASV